jgi:hypothetical protein
VCGKSGTGGTGGTGGWCGGGGCSFVLFIKARRFLFYKRWRTN